MIRLVIRNMTTTRPVIGPFTAKDSLKKEKYKQELQTAKRRVAKVEQYHEQFSKESYEKHQLKKDLSPEEYKRYLEAADRVKKATDERLRTKKRIKPKRYFVSQILMFIFFQFILWKFVATFYYASTNDDMDDSAKIYRKDYKNKPPPNGQ